MSKSKPLLAGRSLSASPPPTPAPRRRLWWLAGLLLPIAVVTALLLPRASDQPSDRDMVWIPAGEFVMGSSEAMGIDQQPNSLPLHRVWVDGFWMDRYEVTNAQFAEFVRATGYKTIAELPPPPELLAQALPEYRNVGPFSLVFTPPQECPPPEQCHECNRWWKIVAGACWKHPQGPGSSIEGKDNYPVVHIAYADAVAYAEWAGCRLPTEAEWERAARGGLPQKRFYWGDEERPNGRWMANYFQGRFPCEDTGEDGFAGIAPVGSYPPNAYGLYDMAGNVWEWCSDWYRPAFEPSLTGLSRNPTGPTARPGDTMRVLRGGSFLCADSYCARYRAGGRQPGDVTTGQSHGGFRCVRSGKDRR